MSAIEPAAVDRLVKLSDVTQLTTLKRSAIYRRVAEGRFPAPVRLSAKATRWRLSAVEAWLAQQSSEVPA